MRGFFPFLVLLAVLSFMLSCGGGKDKVEPTYRLPDTLRVGTLYSPTGFFILKGDTMGYDYDRICDFARSKGIALRFVVARSMPDLVKLLEKKRVDVLACEIPVTAEYKSRVLHCGAVNETHQVLVQHSGKDIAQVEVHLVQEHCGKDAEYHLFCQGPLREHFVEC